MKSQRVILLTFGYFLGSILAQDTTKRAYTTKYDNIDIEAVIRNQRLLKNYVGCLLERNPCTPDASELKKNLPESLATNCGSCSEAQRRISDRLAHHLIDNKPDDWSLLEKKYDPTGDYRRRYLHEQDDKDNSNKRNDNNDNNNNNNNNDNNNNNNNNNKGDQQDQ